MPLERKIVLSNTDEVKEDTHLTTGQDISFQVVIEACHKLRVCAFNRALAVACVVRKHDPKMYAARTKLRQQSLDIVYFLR